jgi:flagellar basal-body rod protein FlgC
MFDALDISSSALTAQRTRLDTIAANIANLNTTRNAAGEHVPYRRKFAVFAPGQSDDPSKAGVHVAEIHEDDGKFREVLDPTHPDADPKTGIVLFPNIDLSVEYVNALEASRAYEANVTTMETTKSMINSALRLLA